MKAEAQDAHVKVDDIEADKYGSRHEVGSTVDCSGAADGDCAAGGEAARRTQGRRGHRTRARRELDESGREFLPLSLSLSLSLSHSFQHSPFRGLKSAPGDDKPLETLESELESLLTSVTIQSFTAF